VGSRAGLKAVVKNSQHVPGLEPSDHQAPNPLSYPGSGLGL